MKHCTISELLNYLTVSTFVKRKWIEVRSISEGQYSVNKYTTRFKIPMLRSDLCHYSDASLL